jgi:undecaprenyl-diphosphatase
VGTRDLTRWYTPLGKVLARLARTLSARLGPHAALILILAAGAIIAVTLSLATALVYDAVTESDGIAGLDSPVLAFMLTLRSPELNSFVTGYTDIAGPIGMPILAVLSLVILALMRRSWTPVILISAAGIGSVLMTSAGKELVGRHRPPLVDAVAPYEFSPSFPSGHTLNAVVVVGIIGYLLVVRQHSLRARVLTVSGVTVFALAVGVSRVYLGHHWFTDVVAGWLIGAAWLALIITAHRLYLTSRHHDPADTGATTEVTADDRDIIRPKDVREGDYVRSEWSEWKVRRVFGSTAGAPADSWFRLSEDQPHPRYRRSTEAYLR